MMKKLIVLLFLFIGFNVYAQPCADEDTVRGNSASLITYNSARINGSRSHFAVTSATLQLKYVRVGQTDTATASQSGALFNITGLQPSTQYYYYYKTICPSGTASQTIGAYSFTTLANTIIYTPMRPTEMNYAKIDSNFKVPRVDTSVYRAPGTSGGDIVFKTSDNTFYGYNGTSWEPLAGSGAPVTASNGLTKTANDIKLGGTLTGNTTIPLGAYNLTVNAGTSGSYINLEAPQLIFTSGNISTIMRGDSTIISMESGSPVRITDPAGSNGLIVETPDETYLTVKGDGLAKINLQTSGVVSGVLEDNNGAIALQSNRGYLTINPFNGDLRIDNLKSSAAAADSMMVWDAASGKVGIRTIPTGGGSGVDALSAIGSTPNANGSTITGTTFNLQKVNASFGGVLTTGTDTIAGPKRFIDPMTVSDFNYYVSTAGNNSNSGKLGLPKQTLASIAGLTSTGINTGDLYREELTPSVAQTLGTYAKTSFKKYAEITGSDVQTSWSTAGTIYSKSITHSIGTVLGYNEIIVVEIDTLLELTSPFAARKYLNYKADTTTVAANAGSYNFNNANPSTVYIKPTTGNPNSNKYRYEVSVRGYPINGYAQNNLVINNLWMREGGNGYGTGLGDNTTINNSIFSGFATHHAVIKSGNLNNVLFGKTGRGYDGGITPLAFYESNASGNVSTVSNSIFWKLPNDILIHSSGGVGQSHQKVTLFNLYSFGDSTENTTSAYTTSINTDNLDSLMLDKVYIQDKGTAFSTSAPFSDVRNTAFVRTPRFAVRLEHPGSPVQSVNFTNMFWVSNTNNSNYSGASQPSGFIYRPNTNATVSIQQSILHAKSRQTSGGNPSSGVNGMATFNNNIVICDLGGSGYYVDFGAPAASENNVYILVNGGGFRWTGSPYHYGLAAWQAASGLDVNSIFIDLSANPLGLRAVFVDPESGNYTLVESQWKSQIMALSAGMTTPIKKFIPMPAEDEAAKTIMDGTLETVLTGAWMSGDGGTNYVFPYDKKMTITSTTSQMRLAYDATKYADFTVSSAGLLTIAPIQGVTLNFDGTFSTMKRGTLKTGGATGIVAAPYYGMQVSRTTNNYLSPLFDVFSNDATSSSNDLFLVRNSSNIWLNVKGNGSVGINVTEPNASAQLDVTSTTKGFLPPRMTKTQRDAISSPATGLVVYQTDNTPGLRCYNGTNWMRYTETID